MKNDDIKNNKDMDKDVKREDIIHIILAVISIFALILALMSFTVFEPDDGKDNEEKQTPNTITYYINETTPPNNPPTASISSQSSSVKIGDYTHFNAAGSTDSDGNIIEYTWDFGDGIKDSGIYANHIFTEAGDFNVTLTVIDDDGGMDNDSISISILPNDPPVASISVKTTAVQTGENIYLNASDSYDSDGNLIEYTWDFGDGAMDSGVYTYHIYSSAGDYTVSLTVFDNDGATDINIIIITAQGIAISNTPPIAELNVSDTYVEDQVSISFDARNSTDSDGAIVAYIWDLGNGMWANDIIFNYAYETAGTYNVILTVYDNNGASNTTNVTIIVIPRIPTAELDLTETTSGNYTGGFIHVSGGPIYLADVSMNISDVSLGEFAIQEPISSGVPLQVPGGVSIIYNDPNGNSEIDSGDIIQISGGASGDQIRFNFIPTGGFIAGYTIP